MPDATEGPDKMNTTKKQVSKLVVAIITAAVTALVTVFINNAFQDTQADERAEAKFVHTMSDRFGYIDKNMSFEQAIDRLYTELQSKDATIDSLSAEIKTLGTKTEEMLDAMVVSPKLVVDGLEKKVANKVSSNGVIVNDGSSYYSENMVEEMTNASVSYSSEDNTVYFNTTGEKKQEVTQVNLLDTDVLYDGERLAVLHPSDGKLFHVGSETYAEGFSLTNTLGLDVDRIVDDEWKNYDNWDYAAAFFDLKGQYTKLSFDVGREVSSGDKHDALLQVYLDDVLVDERQLSASQSMTHMDIPLNNAKNLRLTLTKGHSVRYAFVNAVLSNE